MKNLKIGLSVGVPFMSALLSQVVLAQDADSPPTQAANWVCTLQVANPMSGMDGEAPLFCVQWTEPFYAKAIGGMEGMDGMSGMSGMDGMSGMSGMDGMSGMSGMDGMSGMSGMGGMSGMSGMDGMSGMSGMDGMSGMSGMGGMSGMSGMGGMSGMSGMDGMSGMSGMGGMSGMSGMGGMSGMSGMGGMSGMSGMDGMSGMSGMGGMSGMSGMDGMSGMSGMGGMSGMSGMDGQQGGYSVTLSELSFGVASATLGPRGKAYIRQQMAELPIQPQSKFKIIGHTDNVGSADSNLTLSFARAKAVKEYFVASGIDEDLIEASGQGESAPIASNDTPEGRKKNRRVEVIIY